MMHKLCFIGLGCLGLLLGCSSDEEEPRRTRESFCREWAEAACSQTVINACQASNAEACRLSQTAFCLTLVPDSFADEGADACLTAVGRAYRDADLSAGELQTVLRLGAPCNRVIRGPRDEGESCSRETDCDVSGGFTCVIKGDAESGTCEVPESVGGGFECTAAQQVCATGFYCNGQNCIAYVREGGPCTNQEQCGPQAFCSEGACTARFAVDEPCTDDLQCVSGVCYSFGEERVCTDNLRLSRSEPHCQTLR